MDEEYKNTKKVPAISLAVTQDPYISEEISWLAYNQRVLDQVTQENKTLLERCRFLAISAANLDEFFMVRIGNLYNAIDYKNNISHQTASFTASFLQHLLTETKAFFKKQHTVFLQQLLPLSEKNNYTLFKKIDQLSPSEQVQLKLYCTKKLFPILQPVYFDHQQDLPFWVNGVLVLGIILQDAKKMHPHYACISIPPHIPRYYVLKRDTHVCFIPMEEIIRTWVGRLLQPMTVLATTLLRITRNSTFSLEESDAAEGLFLEELKRKLKKRKQSRVVRVEVEATCNPGLLALLQHKLALTPANFFPVPEESLFDFTGLMQLVQQSDASTHTCKQPVPALSYPDPSQRFTFESIQQKAILLHHPYNSMDLVLDLLEQAAEDPYVLVIKMTLYRVAQNSSIIAALVKAAQNGKHVSVLFEVKVRFQEEYNMQEARKLEQAGCFVFYGIGSIKVHAKLMMIVRQEGQQATHYVHISSGNYNEKNVRCYADLSLVTTDVEYAHDVANFFNFLTGCALPPAYKHLVTAPVGIREQLIAMIKQEATNKQKGLPAGIAIKVNALADKQVIDALYQAAQVGVPIRLIVRGICCLIPGKEGLSETITVFSIVGGFLEHTRIFYFHQQGNPKVYIGSSDIMQRSFERRIEVLFHIKEHMLKQQIINVLAYNLKDNVNCYQMQPDGTYSKQPIEKEAAFNLHQAFFDVTLDEVMQTKLFA